MHHILQYASTYALPSKRHALAMPDSSCRRFSWSPLSCTHCASHSGPTVIYTFCVYFELIDAPCSVLLPPGLDEFDDVEEASLARAHLRCSVDGLDTVALLVAAKLVVVDEAPRESAAPVDPVIPDRLEHLRHCAPIVQGARNVVSLTVKTIFAFTKDRESKLASHNWNLECVADPGQCLAVQTGRIVVVGVRLVADVPAFLRHIDGDNAEREERIAAVFRTVRNTIWRRDDQVWRVQILEVQVCIGPTVSAARKDGQRIDADLPPVPFARAS